jgi:hypothetical protein
MLKRTKHTIICRTQMIDWNILRHIDQAIGKVKVKGQAMVNAGVFSPCASQALARDKSLRQSESDCR